MWLKSQEEKEWEDELKQEALEEYRESIGE
jgi:hypothetical protein